MNKILPLIEQVILRSFSDVMDVRFENRSTYLGSSPELPEDERTINTIIIIVTINNLKKGYTWYDISILKKEIMAKVDDYFNLNYAKYGSGWDFEFYQAKRERV